MISICALKWTVSVSVVQSWKMLLVMMWTGLCLTPHSVNKVFEYECEKGRGPDNLSAFFLKTFSDELSPVWHRLFQLSIDTHTAPELWKKSIIIPVTKIPCPQVNNDYWPFALTSNVMKSLERLLLGVFKAEVAQSLDHLQFASSKKTQHEWRYLLFNALCLRTSGKSICICQAAFYWF